MSELLNFAVITIFARETLEGGIIIGEYRTVILRSEWNDAELTQRQALRVVTVSAIVASVVALIVCAAVAIPLAVLSRDFNPDTAVVIEGVSKIVAGISILQLSLKIPKFFGIYYSKNQVKRLKNGEPWEEIENSPVLSLRHIRFNVAWNIWREVAECGIFLIPFFLAGDEVKSIPLSALLGLIVGGIICIAIYYANQRMQNTRGLTIFTVGLLLFLSTGLFSGGCHKFEMVYESTPVVFSLEGDFWDVNRLPMTIFKPFGYDDTNTVLQIVSYWVWMFSSLLLHYRKWKMCRKIPQDEARTNEDIESSVETPSKKESLTDAEETLDPEDRASNSTSEVDSV